MLLHMSTSPYRNTLSQGTRTLSKKAKASISSNRDPRGWSKLERSRSNGSRHWNLSPGVSQGIANAKDVRPGAPVGSRWERAGYTAISSAMGRVASTRAPWTIIPSSVSLTTDKASSTESSRAVAAPERFRWMLTSVWVSTRSFSRTIS